MSSDALTLLSAVEIAALVARREVSAAEVTAATFARVEETEGTIHAFINLDRAAATAAGMLPVSAW